MQFLDMWECKSDIKFWATGLGWVLRNLTYLEEQLPASMLALYLNEFDIHLPLSYQLTFLALPSTSSATITTVWPCNVRTCTCDSSSFWSVLYCITFVRTYVYGNSFALIKKKTEYQIFDLWRPRLFINSRVLDTTTRFGNLSPVGYCNKGKTREVLNWTRFSC